jgi:hypothetical protein
MKVGEVKMAYDLFRSLSMFTGNSYWNSISPKIGNKFLSLYLEESKVLHWRKSLLHVPIYTVAAHSITRCWISDDPTVGADQLAAGSLWFPQTQSPVLVSWRRVELVVGNAPLGWWTPHGVASSGTGRTRLACCYLQHTNGHRHRTNETEIYNDSSSRILWWRNILRVTPSV